MCKKVHASIKNCHAFNFVFPKLALLKLAHPHVHADVHEESSIANRVKLPP